MEYVTDARPTRPGRIGRNSESLLPQQLVRVELESSLVHQTLPFAILLLHNLRGLGSPSAIVQEQLCKRVGAGDLESCYFMHVTLTVCLF